MGKPKTLEQRFDAAAYQSADALAVFKDAADDLRSANSDLVVVAVEIQSEIDRLTSIGQDVDERIGLNNISLGKIAELIGEGA